MYYNINDSNTYRFSFISFSSELKDSALCFLTRTEASTHRAFNILNNCIKSDVAFTHGKYAASA